MYSFYYVFRHSVHLNIAKWLIFLKGERLILTSKERESYWHRSLDSMYVPCCFLEITAMNIYEKYSYVWSRKGLLYVATQQVVHGVCLSFLDLIFKSSRLSISALRRWCTDIVNARRGVATLKGLKESPCDKPFKYSLLSLFLCFKL